MKRCTFIFGNVLWEGGLVILSNQNLSSSIFSCKYFGAVASSETLELGFWDCDLYLFYLFRLLFLWFRFQLFSFILFSLRLGNVFCQGRFHFGRGNYLSYLFLDQFLCFSWFLKTLLHFLLLMLHHFGFFLRGGLLFTVRFNDDGHFFFLRGLGFFCY